MSRRPRHAISSHRFATPPRQRTVVVERSHYTTSPETPASAVDREEDERFERWLQESEAIVKDHKDATGWEEPPRLLGRLRRRSHSH